MDREVSSLPSNHSSTASPVYNDVDEGLPIDLGAMWDALWSNKVLLAIGLLMGAICSVGFAWMQPVYFTAQVRIMPPGSQSSGGAQAALLGALGGLGGGAASALGIKSPGELYVGLLKSRTIADELISKFDLKKSYETKTMQETRTALTTLSKVASGKDGIITIDVEDQDPKRAADMANGYFNALQSMMQRMATTEAGQRRLFFENQLKQAKNQLTDAEEAFKGMQQKTGVLQLDAQGKVAIESVARIRAAISAKEVELAAVRQFATPENPQYQRPATELAALRGELLKLERAQTGGGDDKSARKLTDSGVDYVRRLRDLKYAEAMFELMAKQFEFARVDEARETASLQLIDTAVVPELKSRPKRGLVVVGGLFLTLMLLVAFVLFKTRKEWYKSEALAKV
jgi:capsule polysaccharide export protein KpsE/RkpR